LLTLKLQINQKKRMVIIAIAISVVACNKTEVEVKTAYVDTSILMREYTEAKDLEAKYKAQSSEKGRQLEAEINRFKQDASNFQAQAQIMDKSGRKTWMMQKRTRIRLCTASFNTTTTTRC
jgi:outer membrane protein